MTDTLWKPDRAAEEMGCSVKTLREYVRSGELVYIPIGCGTKRPRLAFLPNDVREFLASRRRRDTCQSTSPKTARSTTTTSKSPEGGFMGHQARRRAEKQKR